MKIDAIYLRELNLPLVRPFQTSFGITTDRRVVLAEVHSEGLIGSRFMLAGDCAGTRSDACCSVS